MYIVIDDTYGPNSSHASSYVTSQRRTHVAVAFQNNEVDYCRRQIHGCIKMINDYFGCNIGEFHFSDIYNRRDHWKRVDGDINLRVFQAFSNIYSEYRWPVYVQTIDDRTLKDHNINIIDYNIGGLSLSRREDLSLAFLLYKISKKYITVNCDLSIVVDEGMLVNREAIVKNFFRDWVRKVSFKCMSSHDEHLIQIADFLAFCINRSTYLSIKENRSEIDNWFLDLVAKMKINSDDLLNIVLPQNFTKAEFDDIHAKDIERKMNRLVIK
ncbi:DUF3800 domain-containing protein [Candidatus Magnetaquicoccus inordinatus]|uniref:DUF3800 domain-containing protein n=1 Tax=Candidatus Magnetaquicoccus inordinatus TaxID=2496818 RepID=UPI00102CDFA1|nr:DUF3800 domain-containing protein [Candidatus Magnetaquicoccus inordinatus]